MSVSSKIIQKIEKIIKEEKDLFKSNNLSIKKLNQKVIKHMSGKNLYYHKENLKEKPKEIKINKDLCILNLISMKPNRRKSTDKTTSSEKFPHKNSYDVFMINKYDESLNSSLNFISEFDLENQEKNEDSSFNSSDNEENCDQIKIETISHNLSDFDEEYNIKREREWNDIKKLLLGKEI